MSLDTATDFIFNLKKIKLKLDIKMAASFFPNFQVMLVKSITAFYRHRKNYSTWVNLFNKLKVDNIRSSKTRMLSEMLHPKLTLENLPWFLDFKTENDYDVLNKLIF
jgi:hypothetical protein